VDLRLVAGYLEKEGIGVVTLNEHQGGNPGVPHWALSVWAELWVRDPAQFARARELLHEYQAAQRRGDTAEWRCGKCKESNPGTFEVCWNCGRAP